MKRVLNVKQSRSQLRDQFTAQRLLETFLRLLYSFNNQREKGDSSRRRCVSSLFERVARMFGCWDKKNIARKSIKHVDSVYVSFIRHSQVRLKCRERFTVKQVLRLIAAMILLLCINSVIVVTKSICYDTWGVVKLFNVYYKNNVLTCSPTSPSSPRSSLLHEMYDYVDS